MLIVAASWQDPAEDPAPHCAWARDAWADLRPWALGTNVNHLGDEGIGRIREAYPPATWRRLTALKARMDPDNVFAMNQNIPPERWPPSCG
jgi:FAD/FMN-containing dehydrogenase